MSVDIWEEALTHTALEGHAAINAAACHFYQKMGCTLGAIDRFAYPGLPGETQLLWWRALASDGLSTLACRLPRTDP